MATGDSECGREGALQRRLDEMRSERNAELKRLRRSAEPSVDASRRTLSQLMSQRQQQSDSSTEASSSSPPTASARAVLVEVRGLCESRPVSRILQSSSFRTELESIVRASLTPREAAVGARPATSTAPRTSTTPAAPAASTSLADLTRQRREEFVQEIGELLHTQLVTNALDSGFRGRLESSVRRRADALPDGGSRSLAILASLPPRRVGRNDFSHLGIVPPDQQSLSGSSDLLADDAVSVVSLTAAPIAADAATGRQLRQVQKELAELKRIMRLLMTGQQETQRMVRQEVSAALAGRRPPETPQAQPQPPAGCCLVCLTSPADTVMYRCGHLCLCAACSLDLRSRGGSVTCPVCRAAVTDMMRVFAAGVSNE